MIGFPDRSLGSSRQSAESNSLGQMTRKSATINSLLPCREPVSRIELPFLPSVRGVNADSLSLRRMTPHGGSQGETLGDSLPEQAGKAFIVYNLSSRSADV